MQRGKGVIKHATDVKIFILFLLNTLRYPLAGDEIAEIMTEDGFVADYDFSICFSELCDLGHIIHETVDGKDMYMISPMGLEAAESLEDTVLAVIRKQSMQTATRYLSLRRRGAWVESSVAPRGDGYFSVTCRLLEKAGEISSFTLSVPSVAVAEQIRAYFAKRPEEVMRGMLSTATGELGYLLSGYSGTD